MWNTLREHTRAEAEKLKQMNMKEKLDYIREYYKIHIIAAAVFLFIVGSIVNTVWINPPKKDYLSVSFQNFYLDETTRSTLIEELTNALISPEEQENFQIAIDWQVENSGDVQMDMANTQKFVAMVASRQLDILIVEALRVPEYAEQGLLGDLRDFIGTADMEKIKDSILTAKMDDGDIAAAVSLSNIELFANTDKDMRDRALGVVANTERTEKVKAALRYMLNLKG